MILLAAILVTLASPLETARARCGEANALALRLDANAVAAFDEAITLYRGAMSELHDFSEVVSCLLDYAQALNALKNERTAEVLRRALTLDPELKANPHQYAPSLITHLNRLRSQLARAPTGSLSLAGEPRGATVQLDTRTLGELPLSVDGISEGEHWLLVKADGHEPFTGIIRTQANVVTRVDVFLKHAPMKPVVAASQPLRVEVAASIPIVTQPVVSAPPRRSRPALAWLPFGLGQFLERRPLAGALFLGSQAALFATDLGAYFSGQRFREVDGYYTHVSTVEALKWTANIAAGLLIADVLAGCIEGLIHALMVPHEPD